mmetsp:Transcript_16804/g.23206  ORF Transcript_16804/g.23206 Transcript_16804/m.23206 type:complete len:339 (+) Transcript_16804:2-1018(+)
MAVWKVAPCLASGSCLVLKPSEEASLSCLKLASILHQAGLPPGVFNIVTGLGSEAGAALARHPDLDKVAFTGSVATGREVMRAAAVFPRPVGLELGGKSAMVLFEDADIEQAVEWAMFGCFWTNGQICSSTSRLLVHSSVYERVLRRLEEEAPKIPVGDPRVRGCRLGPLISRIQQDKVLGHIQLARQQGARLVTGGGRPEGLPTGYFIQPTVFADVTPSMSLWQSEVFGPVLAVCSFTSEEEALRLANQSDFGLASAVLTKCPRRAERFIRGSRTGIVWVNCSQPCFPQLPWGGLKRSGFGRDLGQDAIDNFCNTKQVCTYVKPTAFGWYPSFKAKL